MAMIVRLIGCPRGITKTPMLIFKNRLRSYPMQGVLDIVEGVYYRIGPKGIHFQKDQHGRTKILFMDNC